MASESGKPHLQDISRVYGPETWEVYDLLGRSLDPRGPDVMNLHWRVYQLLGKLMPVIYVLRRQ